MIDFRYHLVSLIAVFMALAVGIVIGAGPLRDYLAEELSGQVDQLRVEKDELRELLDESEAARAQSDEFITGAGPLLVDGALPNRTVALVQLPSADSDVVDAVAEQLEQSGAQITGRTELTEAWTDPSQAAFRSGIAGNIAPYLNPAPEDDARTEHVLGMALGQALTLRDPDNTSESSAEARDMYDLLISSELIGEVTAPESPAYATVIVAGEIDENDAEQAQTDNGVLVSSLGGLAEAGEGIVLAGPADNEWDLVAAVRAQEALSTSMSTVDAVNLPTGQVTVPLALAHDISSESLPYGVSATAQQVIPGEVTLGPPNPDDFAPGPVDAPADPEDSDADSESDSDDGDSSGGDDEGGDDNDDDGGDSSDE